MGDRADRRWGKGLRSDKGRETVTEESFKRGVGAIARGEEEREREERTGAAESKGQEGELGAGIKCGH
jgi:hypothetical protein